MNANRYPLKRRREFLETSTNHNSELIKFVLETQCHQRSDLSDMSKPSDRGISVDLNSEDSVRGMSCNQSMQSRSLCRAAVSDLNPLAANKRKLIDSFEGLSLSSNRSKGPRLSKEDPIRIGKINSASMQTNADDRKLINETNNGKKVLIQVLDSVEFN